jgi:hypothetical protein
MTPFSATIAAPAGWVYVPSLALAAAPVNSQW